MPFDFKRLMILINKSLFFIDDFLTIYNIEIKTTNTPKDKPKATLNVFKVSLISSNLLILNTTSNNKFSQFVIFRFYV